MGKTRRTSACTALTAMVAMLVLAACGEDGASDATGPETISLQYAFYGPPGSHAGQQVEEWAAQVNERTDGRVEVDTFLGGSLLGTGDIYDGVSNGVVDVGLDSPHNDEGRFPFTSVASLPLGIPDAQVGSAVLLDLIEEFQPSEYDGYEVLTAFTAEPSFVQTVDRVESRADLAGMELRVGGANVGLAQELGVTPIGMPIPDVAEALQTGVVDGYISSRDVLKDFGLGEMIKYYVDYPFGLAGTFVAVMDADAYADLPDDVKEVIADLRPEMMEFAATYQDEESVATSIQWAVDEHGLEVVELDESERAGWDAAAEVAIESWVQSQAGADFNAQAVLDRARELIAEHS